MRVIVYALFAILSLSACLKKNRDSGVADVVVENEKKENLVEVITPGMPKGEHIYLKDTLTSKPQFVWRNQYGQDIPLAIIISVDGKVVKDASKFEIYAFNLSKFYERVYITLPSEKYSYIRPIREISSVSRPGGYPDKVELRICVSYAICDVRYFLKTSKDGKTGSTGPFVQIELYSDFLRPQVMLTNMLLANGLVIKDRTLRGPDLTDAERNSENYGKSFIYVESYVLGSVVRREAEYSDVNRIDNLDGMGEAKLGNPSFNLAEYIESKCARAKPESGIVLEFKDKDNTMKVPCL